MSFLDNEAGGGSFLECRKRVFGLPIDLKAEWAFLGRSALADRPFRRNLFIGLLWLGFDFYSGHWLWNLQQ
jgi:hypothetical protein